MDPFVAFALALIPAIALAGLLILLRRDRSVQAGTSNAQPHTATRLSVLDEMTDGVLLSDRLGRLSYMNRAARKALGLADLTLPAPLEVALRNQEDLLALLCVDAANTAERPIQSLELIDDHARRAFDVEMKDLIDSTTAQSMRLVVMRDVTARNASERQLRRSELGLRQIIDLFPHHIYARDRSGKFLMANRAGAEAYELEPRDVIDRTIFDVGLPDETIARMLGQDQVVIETGEEQHYQVTHPTADGESVFQTTKIPFLIPETGEQAVLSIAIDMTERIRTEERIRALAFYDSLTGLPNRRRFQRLLGRTLETARRKQGRFALLFLDLDRFKEVNDRLGHSTGDHLLRDVAERLRDCVRMTDELAYADGDPATPPPDSGELTPSSNEMVSRLAGDEFTILLSDVVNPINAAMVAKRIIDAMSRPFFVGSEEVFITASIGIALYPEDGLGSDALLRCADQAMYEAKRTGPNHYAFFDASMNAVAARRHEIHLHLRRAIESNELSLVYQQIRTAASGRICGCEALLRWQSEELGSVGPDEFIPVAEETGLIGEIGAWVFKQVCQQRAAWRDQGLDPVRIAVNVSTAQLQVPRFAADVRAVMNDLGVTPDEIEFELTETAILAQDRQTDDNLRRLSEMGVALTLDDFGTGQSSLSNLRRFAFSRIKIDRSFVAEIPGNRDDANLTDAIIAMAHGLRLTVVAEGVETEEQLHFLRNHDCDELQGYLFARPESAEEFATHLESVKPDGRLARVLSSCAMSEEERYQRCRSQLERYGQGHVLAAWQRLTPSERDHLLGEIETIPWDRVAPLIESHVRSKPAEEALHNLTPPPFFATQPANDAQTAQYRDASALGRQCLRDGRVAAFTVAGGQGSRLGVNGPKGCVEVTPVRNKSLFQLFAETVKSARDRYGAPIRWYIMTSPANHDDTLAFFDQHAYFGLPREDVVAFPQGMLPSFDFQGRILLAEPHGLALAPDGHGGALRALSASGALADMEQRGVDIISYFQVDNPLVQPFDPLFIGLHAGERSEMSSKVTRKAHALEKVGNLCIHNGRLQVIEYSDFPEGLAHATNANGTRTFDLGSIAIHLLDVAFAARLGGADHELPYHRAEKKVAHVDPDTGTRHAPSEPNGVKLESFVFDAIPLAANPILLEVERAEEFSPVKNPDSEPADSAATARRDQVRRAAAWLEAAGAEIPRDASGEPRACIELAPSYALAREDIDPASAKAQRYEDDVYLE